MLSRRTLLLTAAPSSVTWPARAGSGASSERWIWAVNRAGEEVAVAYRSGNSYNAVALARLRHLFRDLHEDLQGPLPGLLVDILSVLQERWAYRRPLVIGSGYRTPRTNGSIEGAAPGSLHLQGLAADITMQGVHPDELGAVVWMLSRRLGFMGIGLYTGFVHVDIGPQRVWTRVGS
ncbi:DUF882 domain-containing protein [Siccirubricoccus sp. G192]|uniref:YcbK family protein n=1 Tax=Siccirubricoccus sp. G192 TaxID=2849651 RepID=UPI0020C32A4D|nr:DUF882 domain-containing protein [Siccirubricoccus sp. G192]